MPEAYRARVHRADVLLELLGHLADGPTPMTVGWPSSELGIRVVLGLLIHGAATREDQTP